MSIQPLPADVIAQIKSSTTIVNLNQVVIGLVKNSLDSSSTKIDITVDYTRGSCAVEDDGHGIQPSEFQEQGGLGRLHYSSKLHSHRPTHGTYGTFLASLAALSFLSITSRHELHSSHNALRIHASRVIARQIPAPTHLYLSSANHGTRVVVRDLFGSMPVRVRQRPNASDQISQRTRHFEELKRGIVAILLSWPGAVCLTVHEAGTNHKLQLKPLGHSKQRVNSEAHATCHILSQAGYIEAPDKSSWIRIGASTSRFSISGTVSLIPSPSRQTQFIAFGIQPLMQSEGQTILYDELNRLFMNSTFGTEDRAEELDEEEEHKKANSQRYKSDGYTTKELQCGKKGIDRWPMFHIKITPTQLSRSKPASDLDDVLDDKRNSLGAILELLHATIFEFLSRHHFQPKNVLTRGRKQGTKDTVASVQRNYSSPPLKSQPSVATSNTSRENQGNINTGAKSKLSPYKRDLLNTDKPFDAWSRVKVGALSSKFMRIPNVLQAQGRGKIESTTVENKDEVTIPLNGQSEQPLQPLVSKAGKLVRRPFDDVSLPIERELEDIPLPDVRSEGNPQQETALWINPITRVTSRVDSKTGRVLPLSEGNDEGPPKRLTARLSPHLTGQPLSDENGWIRDLLNRWDNPIFKPAEQAVPHVCQEGTYAQSNPHGQNHQCSYTNAEDIFLNPPAGNHGRISKDSLRKANVIAQVDKKFILVKLELAGPENVHPSTDCMLVLVDQHAADERIHIERLLAELCATPGLGSASGISTVDLEKPLSFDISRREIRLFAEYVQHFTNWGIIYELPPISAATSQPKAEKLIVRGLPPGIVERCKLDPKVLISLLRSEAWAIFEKGTNGSNIPPPISISCGSSKLAWLHRLQSCPQGILDLLNSRACRSSIMFNDELSLDQCRVLIQKLADCAFPFQCAHGRPSMVPLVSLGNVDSACPVESKSTFGPAFNRWRSQLESDDRAD
ncbi:hypothetical protein BP6252_12035 [Coleophoma cylindrospora]|uniref:MutL C-terminal dimerisation domain-containing protein n=1 Tax=Coleophoma cylindrospora TaxID=1849047 RepID=A0A3D8QFN8_9HELO|nr:hypothetical protein BP6252_12035 [Coleophoma cylindrospora]